MTEAPSLPHVAARLASGAALRIIAFGSSTTEGIGATSAAASYPARLAAELAAALPPPGRVAVLNRGVGGEDAEAMARRIPAIIAERPDLVIWQTGSNDMLNGTALSRFTELTASGITALRSGGGDLLLMDAQFCPALEILPDAARYRVALSDIAGMMTVPMVHRYELMRVWLADGSLRRDQLTIDDGLHMTDAGYALLARAVARAILQGAGRGAFDQSPSSS